MEEIMYDFWAAALQDGYIGKLADIVSKAGGGHELYDMNATELKMRLGLSDRLIKHIINRRNSFDIEREYDRMMRDNIQFVRCFDDDYPVKLREICSKPYALFVKGALPGEGEPSVAIVGSRECSEYGRLMAEYFGDRLAGRGISVISGMAYGIDGIAQMASIDAGGKSYAVLGCGVDVVYPRSNARLYERLASGCGGIISEYAPGTPAIGKNFPPRNRIISGLSDLLLVIEAKARSGTLITADMAMDQGRDVGAVPGRITDPLSVGCINLIKTGAFPILSVEDIVERIGMGTMGKAKEEPADDFLIKMSEDEKVIWALLDFYPKGCDELVLGSGFDISKVLSVLTQMEIKGLVKNTGQSYFVKKILKA